MKNVKPFFLAAKSKKAQDTLKLLSIGRNTLANQLREKLKIYE